MRGTARARSTTGRGRAPRSGTRSNPDIFARRERWVRRIDERTGRVDVDMKALMTAVIMPKWRTIKRGSRGLYLPAAQIKSGVRSGDLYAYPMQRSVDRFKDVVRRKTRRRIPLSTVGLIRELNPVIRGWGEYYKRAHVRRLFNQLDRWVVRRLWSHRYKRWRCTGWKTLPARRLRGELGLVSLVSLIPSLSPRPRAATS